MSETTLTPLVVEKWIYDIPAALEAHDKHRGRLCFWTQSQTRGFLETLLETMKELQATREAMEFAEEERDAYFSFAMAVQFPEATEGYVERFKEAIAKVNTRINDPKLREKLGRVYAWRRRRGPSANGALCPTDGEEKPKGELT